MEYVYASLLLHKLGKEINEANLKKVIEAAGSTPDEARIKTLLASLKGIDIETVLKEAGTVAEAAKPEAKPEKKEEKKEEAAEGLAALFG